MRLSERKAQQIRTLVQRHFGDGATVYLFGSRTDDARRGGDIDLFVHVPGVIESKGKVVMAFNAELQRVLGEQRIDVIVRDDATRPQPIHEEALRRGVCI